MLKNPLLIKHTTKKSEASDLITHERRKIGRGQIFYFDDKGKINVKMMPGFKTMFKPNNRTEEGFTIEGDIKIKLSTELKCPRLNKNNFTDR